MSQSYTIKVDGNYEFSISQDDLKKTDILPKGENEYHLIEENQSYHIKTLNSDFAVKKYLISVNGTPYQVDIKDKLDLLIKKMGLTIKDKQKESNVKSPMPGLVLEINVEEGQEVKEGDALLILEAMKMENILTAPKDGIIKRIAAIKGNSVEKGEILITNGLGHHKILKDSTTNQRIIDFIT